MTFVEGQARAVAAVSDARRRARQGGARRSLRGSATTAV